MTLGAAARDADCDLVTQRIVRAVADADGVDPLDLEPLYSAVDADAFGSLFRPVPTLGEVEEPAAEVRFDYQGYEVRVTDLGAVTLSEK